MEVVSSGDGAQVVLGVDGAARLDQVSLEPRVPSRAINTPALRSRDRSPAPPNHQCLGESFLSGKKPHEGQ